MNNEPLIFDDDSPEWTEEMFARARPAHEVLPPPTVAMLVRSAADLRLPDETALPPDDKDEDPLYLAALDVERDERLASEMLDWDGTASDGLANRS